jgi:uncharacterized protein
VTLAGTLLVVVRAGLARGRLFALFAGVLLGTHGAIAAVVFPTLGWLQIIALPLQVVTLINYFMLAKPRMRPGWYRALISIPAAWFVAGSLISFPWAVALAFGFDPAFTWLGWLLALGGLRQSLALSSEDIDLVLDRRPVRGLRRVGHGLQRTPRPLRIVQITDPHLGPFMSVERLRAVCERAVEADPDLVLLTGDYLTMESNSTPGTLAAALEPLKAISGRCYAIRGNHDLEAPQEVAAGLEAVGIRLLIDDAARADTLIGPVQVIGLDWHWQDRKPKMQAVLGRFPRVSGVPRVVLLHDPAAFALLDDGQADLVLSGHTHGGQVGFFNFGWKASVLGLGSVPDHGFWGRGSNRLYVHRGTGHYGYPLRLGVPGEEGVLRLHVLPG